MFGGGFTSLLRNQRLGRSRSRDERELRRSPVMNGHLHNLTFRDPQDPGRPSVRVEGGDESVGGGPSAIPNDELLAPLGQSGRLSVSSIQRGVLERAPSCCETPSASPRLREASANALSVDVGGLSPRPRLRRAETLRPRAGPDPNDPDFLRLKHYKLICEIGQGSYGIVKLAYNERDQSHYAMKILDKAKLIKKFAFFRRPPSRPGKVAGPDPLAQVNKEIAILKKLSHPNVVKLIEVLDDQDDNYLYMVFEYLERGSVLEVPTEEPLSEPTAWRYFRDTLLGLEYLHFQKIVHRDIKPSNLLLTEDDHVKIADFGVSAEFEGFDAFLTGTAGSPAFMAPEALLIKEEKKPGEDTQFYSGKAQDIWSLGITLYTFLFGNVPFWDSYVIALHCKIRTQPLTFPDREGISEGAKCLIRSMLSKDPGKRLNLDETKAHYWVTDNGREPLDGALDLQLVSVTEAEIATSVRVVPSLDTLILIKAMGQRKRWSLLYTGSQTMVGNRWTEPWTSNSSSSQRPRSPPLSASSPPSTPSYSSRLWGSANGGVFFILGHRQWSETAGRSPGPPTRLRHRGRDRHLCPRRPLPRHPHTHQGYGAAQTVESSLYWVTDNGRKPLDGALDLQLVSVTEAEIATSVRVVPSLDTLILIKAMGQRKRFGNPFKRSAVGDIPSNPLATLSLSERVTGKLLGSSSGSSGRRESSLAETALGTLGSLTQRLAPKRSNTLGGGGPD